MARTKKYSKRGRRKRTKRARAKKAPRTKKQLIKLIKKVSLGTQETKQFAADYLPFSILGLITTQEVSIAFNLWGDLPRFKNVATSTEGSFIGDQIYVKGVKLMLEVDGGPWADLSLVDIAQYRFTLISTDNEEAMTTSVYAQATPATWYAPDTYNQTRDYPNRRWNTDLVTVLKTWHRRPKYYSTVTAKHYWKFWLPFGRKFTTRTEESLVTSSYWGTNKGKNYYFIIDATANSTSGSFNSYNAISMAKIVYFKDA